MPTIAFTAFSAFNCRAYEDDSALGTEQSFLHYDPSIRCYEGEEHADIRATAIILAFIWPLGGTLFCASLLHACRVAIWEDMPTDLWRATAFLHREFRAGYSQWEGGEALSCRAHALTTCLL